MIAVRAAIAVPPRDRVARATHTAGGFVDVLDTG
jgi:hypothetical protein